MKRRTGGELLGQRSDAPKLPARSVGPSFVYRGIPGVSVLPHTSFSPIQSSDPKVAIRLRFYDNFFRSKVVIIF